MKVYAVALLAFVGAVLAEETQYTRRATEDYSPSTVKPVTQTQETQSYTQSKYQQPSYVFQTKAQTYTAPQQLNYVLPQTYKFLPQPGGSGQVSYVPQQPQQVVQYQHQPTQQVTYNTQASAKPEAVQPQKVYTQQPQAPAQAIQYSSAGDVSSFKYQSPFVTYSNLGVLQQSIGKVAQSEAPRQYSQPAPAPQEQPQQQVYTPQPQFVYRPKIQIPQVQYTQAPQQAPATRLIYSQAPQTFQTQKQQPLIYQQVAAKQAASQPQQFVYMVPAQYSYNPSQYSAQGQAAQQHTVQQPVYVVAPQYQAALQQYQQQQQHQQQ